MPKGAHKIAFWPGRLILRTEGLLDPASCCMALMNAIGSARLSAYRSAYSEEARSRVLISPVDSGHGFTLAEAALLGRSSHISKKVNATACSHVRQSGSA